MGTTSIPWEKSAEARLIRLWLDGETGERIAAELGVTRSAVLGKAARLGLYRQKPRKDTAPSPKKYPEARMTSAVANAIVASIPPDRRTLMQRFFGDPPPGRSALEKRMAAPRFDAGPVKPGFAKRVGCEADSMVRDSRPARFGETV